jgi:exodeoxyribonuclease VII large subunit
MSMAPIFTVSDFVAVFNQTLEAVYPSVDIVGELANFRVSKNRWVYFDLKDQNATVKFFGTIYNLPGPLEDGLLLQVKGQPRLHPLFGFSVNITSIQPVGEGSLRRAAQLLEAKLRAEGLFELDRKRPLPYPPKTIGLITSEQSAAYADFIKILNARWVGVKIGLADVQVQGEPAPGQIVAAIEHFNQSPDLVDVLVIIRGGGSAEDLAAFNTEPVTRAIAASRIPTLAAIGHEVDVSLAELASDRRASTPSNAAELLVPDKRHELQTLTETNQRLGQYLSNFVRTGQEQLTQQISSLNQIVTQYIKQQNIILNSKTGVLSALSPQATLDRGYAIVRQNGKVVRRAKLIKAGSNFEAQLADGKIHAKAREISLQ